MCSDVDSMPLGLLLCPHALYRKIFSVSTDKNNQERKSVETHMAQPYKLTDHLQGLFASLMRHAHARACFSRHHISSKCAYNIQSFTHLAFLKIDLQRNIVQRERERRTKPIAYILECDLFLFLLGRISLCFKFYVQVQIIIAYFIHQYFSSNFSITKRCTPLS